MVFDMNSLIRSGDFCYIITDKFLEFGVPEGDIVYIAGQKAVPENEEDPYTQRVKMFIHRTDDNNHVLFDEIYMMDPRSLEKVDGDTMEELVAILKADIEFYESEPKSEAIN